MRKFKETRKTVIINIIVIILIAGVLEFVSRLYDRHEIRGFPPAPNNAEGFGDFPGFLRYAGKFMRVEQYIKGGYSNIYEPYTATGLMPNYVFKINNLNYSINSLGLRSPELVKPKPPKTFRIFILGGSTVEGGFNDRWIISTYLGQELKKYYPGVEVINAGIVGYSSQEELALLQTKILDLQPDLVVIFDGRNDLFYSIRETWENHHGDNYVYCQKAMDGLINYPTFFSLSTNLARFLTKKSSAITRVFRFFFRQKQEAAYPPQVKFKDLAIATYLDNLRLIKATLEVKGIKGIIAFQPTLGYAKDHLTAYEKSIARYLREEEKTDWLAQIRLAWPQVGRKVAALANSGPVRSYDLSRLFEETRETAYVDSCHYTPWGYQMVGAKIAGMIRTDLGGYFDEFSHPASPQESSVKGRKSQ